jgi:hypothetical protein
VGFRRRIPAGAYAARFSSLALLQRLRQNPASITTLGAYLLVSFFYLAIPVISHPGRDLIGFGRPSRDPDLFVWMLAWWPHAILHGTNPVAAHVVWWPQGTNLAWDTSIPGLALLVAPVTLLGGPVLAYNTLAVVLPALAAWTAYLLCRHLTHAFWPSLAGGYLFGFSAYVLGQTEGHLHMTSVFGVPLIALVLVRYVEGSLIGARFVLALAVLLALQISFSTELAFTLTLAIAVSIVVAAIVVPASRHRLRLLLGPLLLAYVVAALLMAPFLGYALLHIQRGAIHLPEKYPADLLNLVIPTRLTALGSSWTRSVSGGFRGNTGENGAYLGVVWLVILGWFAWSFRRVATARLLVALLAIGVVVELGPRLTVDGHYSITLPWRLVSGLPLFNNILPVRISMFVALAASVCVAWWASSRRAPRAARVVLTALAIVTVVPSLWLDAWHMHPDRPAFFTQGTYRTCLEPNDSVLMLPFPHRSDAMLWQAETGFAFRMANGYVNSVIPEGVPDVPFVRRLKSSRVPAGPQPLLAWARAQGVTKIVAAGPGAGAWVRLLSPAVRPQRLGGVDLFDLRGHVCGTIR